MPLFILLLARQLSPLWLRLLLNMYTSILTRVAWNDICSRVFTVNNGVKKGGAVLSPLSFCVYLNE